MEEVLSSIWIVFGRTIQLILWILALPLQAMAGTVNWIRRRRYNPEKAICPGCGFRGDKGTDYKTCRIRFVRTTGNDRANIQHICFRCGCDVWFTKVFLHPTDTWIPPNNADQVARAKEALRRTSI